MPNDIPQTQNDGHYVRVAKLTASEQDIEQLGNRKRISASRNNSSDQRRIIIFLA